LISGKRLNFHLARGGKYAALAGMMIGAAALVVFIKGNASLDVITTGEFRGTTIQVGTGKYFYLGYILLASSVLLCGYLLSRGYKWVSLAPVILAALLYWILGGRARAMTPLAAGLLLLWYRSREQKGWARLTLKPMYILLVPISILCVVWISYIGDLYRGGLGVRAFSDSVSLSELWRYLEWSIFMDFGQLHGLAGAFAVGPGVLAGETFIGSLTWPLPEFLPIPGKSSGIFVLETLLGFAGDEKWAVHPSLIGDAYLNFGVSGVGIVMVLFGLSLKFVYVKFREGTLQSAVYTLALMHSLQIFLTSIDMWQQTLIVITFALAVILLGKTIFQLK
jgi:oligosaccharide repeat unit polymerase